MKIGQNILLIVVGFVFLLIAIAFGSHDIVFMIFASIGGIIMILGVIETVYELVKQVSFSAESALVKLFNIKIYTKRVGFLISMLVRDAKEARGVSLIFLLMVFILGFVIGRMM